jgi:hypothetical protein
LITVIEAGYLAYVVIEADYIAAVVVIEAGYSSAAVVVEADYSSAVVVVVVVVEADYSSAVVVVVVVEADYCFVEPCYSWMIEKLFDTVHDFLRNFDPFYSYYRSENGVVLDKMINLKINEVHQIEEHVNLFLHKSYACITSFVIVQL